MKSVLRRILFAFVGASLIAAFPAGAQTANKTLRAVRGSVGYTAGKDGEFKAVAAELVLPDNDFAITRAASNGLLVLPDSSQVALGENTSIQVGAFNDATSPTPTTLLLQNGTIRFAVRHPAGGRANYRFSTPTSQIAVRGTVALVQSTPTSGDIIACLACAQGDVLVTITSTGRPIPLLTGQTLFVSLAGVVTVATTTETVLSSFRSAGLNTDASETTAFAAGVAAEMGASGQRSGSGSAGLAAAAAAAAAIGVIEANSATNPAKNGAPSPTPSTLPGGVTITSVHASSSPIPSATPTPPSGPRK